MKKGFLYVATGEPYIDEAVASLNSLRRCRSNVHASLITDQPVTADGFDHVIVLDSDQGAGNKKEGFAFKTRAIRHTPYEQSFYVDTDTYFCESCEELFDLLEYYDLLIAAAPSDISLVQIDGKEIPGYVPYNTGVMVFKWSDEMDSLLRTWEAVCHEKFSIYPGNQAPLMEAMLSHKVRTYVLPYNYNFRLPFFISVPGMNVKLLHGRADNYPALEAIINESDSHRSWNPLRQRMSYPIPLPRPTLLQNWASAIRQTIARLLASK